MPADSAEIDLGGDTLSLTMSEDGQTAYSGVQANDKFFVISVPERRILQVIETPAPLVRSMVVVPSRTVSRCSRNSRIPRCRGLPTLCAVKQPPGAIFGHTAVKPSKYLRLVVHLRPLNPLDDVDGMKRLTGDVGYRDILDTRIPQIAIPVAPGRNLAVLVEAAVRSHMLKSKGIDPAQTFIDRQAHQMQRQAPW